MAKERKVGDERIEGVFGQVGMGASDAEKILEFYDTYEQTMATVDRVKAKKTGAKFGDVLEETAKPKEKPAEKK